MTFDLHTPRSGAQQLLEFTPTSEFYLPVGEGELMVQYCRGDMVHILYLDTLQKLYYVPLGLASSRSSMVDDRNIYIPASICRMRHISM